MSRWDAARAASQRTPRKYKACGPVGPVIEALPDAAGALVNGLSHSYKEVYSLGVDVPELGISAHGEYGKRGDGRPTCKSCGYQLCSCAPKSFGLLSLESRMSILDGLQKSGLSGVAQTEALRLLLTGESGESAPVSSCYRSLASDREYHTRDCGERRCALEVDRA